MNLAKNNSRGAMRNPNHADDGGRAALRRATEPLEMTRPCRRVPARTGARHLHRPRAARVTHPTSSQSGFTLVELMVVVTILAILAVVAVMAAQKYIRSARVSEGVNLVGDIYNKQEDFYSTYSVYVSSHNNETNFDGNHQGAGNMSPFYQWPFECPVANNAWCMINFRPQTETIEGTQSLMRWQLQTIGWGPGVAAPAFVQDDTRRWVTVQARGLPNGDLSACVLVRKTNELTDVVIDKEWTECGF